MDFYPSLPWVQSFGKKCCEICSVPHVLAPRKLKNREKVGSDVISAPQIAPWVIQSACKKKKKSKHKYLEWKYKSPEPHTECSLSEQEGLTAQALFVVSNVSERFSGWFVHV